MKLKTQALLSVLTQAVRGIFVTAASIAIFYFIYDTKIWDNDIWMGFAIGLVCLVTGGYFMYGAYSDYKISQNIPNDDFSNIIRL